MTRAGRWRKARRLLSEVKYLEGQVLERWLLVSDTKPLTRMKELAARKRIQAIELLETMEER